MVVVFAGMAMLGWSSLLANAVGYVVGLVLGFALNRSWTFRHTGRLGTAVIRYLAAFAIAYLANLAMLLLLEEWLGISAYVAQLGAMLTYTVVFYLLSKFVVFRS
jgi:putative flippase GtrA